jgi:hypothetical protein
VGVIERIDRAVNGTFMTKVQNYMFAGKVAAAVALIVAGIAVLVVDAATQLHGAALWLIGAGVAMAVFAVIEAVLHRVRRPAKPTIKVPPAPPVATSSLAPAHQRVIERRVEEHRAKSQGGLRTELEAQLKRGRHLLAMLRTPQLALATYARYVSEDDVEVWEAEVEKLLGDERSVKVFRYEPLQPLAIRELQPMVHALSGGRLSIRLQQRLKQLDKLLGES